MARADEDYDAALVDPPGHYDRLLDVSTPHTGTTFFAPARPTLQTIVQAARQEPATPGR
jgi:putative iron-dependent peroxidase